MKNKFTKEFKLSKIQIVKFQQDLEQSILPRINKGYSNCEFGKFMQTEDLQVLNKYNSYIDYANKNNKDYVYIINGKLIDYKTGKEIEQYFKQEFIQYKVYSE